MTVTTFLDPDQMPSPDDDQIPFDNKMAAVFRVLPQFGAEVNATAAGINNAANGVAFAIPYKYLTSTLNNGSAAGGIISFGSTQILVDVKSSAGALVTNALAAAGASTSTVKSYLRITNALDLTKWATYSVSSYALNAGGLYGVFNVNLIDRTSATPFANNDPVILSITPNGDKGDQGTSVNGFSNLIVLATTQNWTVPAGITKGEITVVDGGQSGEGTTGVTGGMGYGGQGGNGGMTVVALSPGTTCTATIGAGGASTANGFSAGGATSFSGTGFTTVTSSSAALKVPGGASGFKANNTDPGIGGGTMLAPAGSTGYGAGGKGGTQGSGIAGKNGVVVIRY